MTNYKFLILFGEEKKVRARIQRLVSFSAHADRQEMYDFLKNQIYLKKLFLVHGEYRTQERFRDYLFQRGFDDIEIPELGQEFQL